MSRAPANAIGLAATVLTALACGAADGGQPGPIVHDSAGVTIVENTSASWSDEEAWRLSETPLVEIGDLADADYTLFGVRSGLRLDDGRIVLANAGTHELRFYDADGAFVLAVGGEGSGPGEYNALQHVWRYRGDSLLAYDFAPPRLSVYSASGELARTFSIQSPDGRQVIVRGPLPDGSLIVEGVPIWDEQGSATGVFRDVIPIYRHGADGTPGDVFGRFPSAEVLRRVTPEGVRLSSVPFARIPAMAVAGDRFYFASGDRYEIDVYSATGALEQRIRLTQPSRPVTEADIEWFRSERLAMAEREGTRARMEQILRETPAPEIMPAHGTLVVDAEDNLWVSDYRAAPDEQPPWRVFSQDGTYLGAVAMPAGFQPLHIGADFVLGRWVNELDVEHVRLYGLIKD